jgi:hypothetical protein
MKAKAKRSFMLNVLRSGCVEQKLWQMIDEAKAEC